ncbi:MAG: twin-arginine translocation signal domain-containing protein [Dehalococcoidales bacterium]|nr:twin-arginine translocation signal domain-containing protein [Dehalococcoidales bacterium]
MDLNRRDFLKLSSATLVGAAVLGGINPSSVVASGKFRAFPMKKKVKETTTICCYCSVGCGALVTAYEDGIIKVEGDPDHPINEGALCPKGQSIAQIHQVDGKINPYRLTKPLYRAPNSTNFVEKSWDWMIDTIAHRVKDTRDKYWNTTANRIDAIASLGGGELDNEECYMLSKMDRVLGLAYMEHCARL